MYTANHAVDTPDKPAIIMATSGETITYAELDGRANQLAHTLRAAGLRRLDHYAIFMENNATYVETCAAGERSGLYYTCINSYLTADEVAFIVNNSESRALITSASRRDVAIEALKQCPNVELALIVGGSGDDGPFDDYDTVVRAKPRSPIDDEALGTSMLYSSGTTGQPKGILRPLPDLAASDNLPLLTFLAGLWRYREGMTYLSPAPLYHSAPQAAVNLALRHGATCVIMERFDPEQYLSCIENYRVTHSQLVPTMFSRMLKLDPEIRNRYDLASLEIAVHAAAPCPIPVKKAMIEWWGPIIEEYYGATEGLGFTACNTQEWLDHPGTVGKVILGDLHVLDDTMNPLPRGVPGTLWFTTATEFQYFNDPAKTKDSTSPDGTMTTVGDVGYLDDDGYLHLTDRKTFMIISGGVNIYPQEAENLLITHPKVMDAAVFGVPNADLGEEVKAVVQVVPGVVADAALERELIAFCHDNLARQKCPRSVDFDAELPRLPTGKLYKRELRDRYWGERDQRASRIV
ncbi:MAG: AMP-binding protein [Acidimicrobiales bacterium]